MATGVLGRRWGTGTEQSHCMRCGLGSPHTLPDHQIAVRTAQDAERSKPEVNLSDEDGNVFSIIGRVRKALRRAGQDALVEEFTNKARAAQSYDAVLQLVFEYCEVN